MSDVQQVFSEWAREVDELADRITWHDLTSITFRVGPHTLAGIDGLCQFFSVSRAKLAQRLVEAAVHDATRAVGLMVTMDDSGQWVAAEDVTPQDAS